MKQELLESRGGRRTLVRARGLFWHLNNPTKYAVTSGEKNRRVLCLSLLPPPPPPRPPFLEAEKIKTHLYLYMPLMKFVPLKMTSKFCLFNATVNPCCAHSPRALVASLRLLTHVDSDSKSKHGGFYRKRPSVFYRLACPSSNGQNCGGF